MMVMSGLAAGYMGVDAGSSAGAPDDRSMGEYGGGGASLRADGDLAVAAKVGLGLVDRELERDDFLDSLSLNDPKRDREGDDMIRVGDSSGKRRTIVGFKPEEYLTFC